MAKEEFEELVRWVEGEEPAGDVRAGLGRFVAEYRAGDCGG